MDQALKQRLVGALVITALAAIFVPMFFEDTVDDSRREINRSDLAIPAAPEQSFSEDNPIPQSPQQVLHAPEGETAAAADTETQEDDSGQEADAQAEQAIPPDAVAVAPEAKQAPPVAAAKPKAETGLASAKKKSQPAKKVTLQPQPKAAPEQLPAQARQNTASAPPPAKNPDLQRWVVQLGSFAKKDNADGLVNRLRAQGYNAYGDTIEVEGKGTMYRVRIGPELDKNRAQATQKQLQQLDALSSIVLAE
jgi:DedD protein